MARIVGTARGPRKQGHSGRLRNGLGRPVVGVPTSLGDGLIEMRAGTVESVASETSEKASDGSTGTSSGIVGRGTCHVSTKARKVGRTEASVGGPTTGDADRMASQTGSLMASTT